MDTGSRDEDHHRREVLSEPLQLALWLYRSTDLFLLLACSISHRMSARQQQDFPLFCFLQHIEWHLTHSRCFQSVIGIGRLIYPLKKQHCVGWGDGSVGDVVSRRA